MNKEQIKQEALALCEEDREWLAELLWLSVHNAIDKEMIAAQLAKESKLSAKDSMQILKEFDSFAND